MRKILPALNLRLKILVVMSCYILGILSMSLVAQKDLSTAGEKLDVLELAYSLNAIVLEIRRYEKNYLLYGTKSSLQDNQQQAELALEITSKIEVLLRKLKAHPIVIHLNNALLSYQEKMELLADAIEGKEFAKAPILAEDLRSKGQEMNEMCKNLVEFEHGQILSILQELLHHLLFWTVLAILIGIFIPLLMFFKIFKPLNIIKKATEDIAGGHFSKIEVVDTRDEMQQVMEALNTMVKELQYRQDQLVQSQKLSSIGTLSAGIAHQLNNPLNNISTSCQIARHEFDEGDRVLLKQMLKNIDQETTRARDVVQGLLEFAREREFALRLTNLADVVQRSINLVRSQVPASIQLQIKVPQNLNLPMDTQRMQEVFLNLIINASQAIDGSGNITISASVSPEKENVLISVHDDGDGIPYDIQDRLFDPFFSTKEEGQGTGLGLSIAYGIIQKHNGDIRVNSTPQEGTTFLIELPLYPNQDGS